MATSWCVKITCLPQGIKNDELARNFNIQETDIFIPPNQGVNYYAWVNGFPNELSAKQFVQKWNDSKIGSSTITCKVSATKGKGNISSRSSSVFGRTCNQSTVNNRLDQLSIHSSDEKRRQSLDGRRGSIRRNIKDNSDPVPVEKNHDFRTCEVGIDCDKFDCPANHPSGRINPCSDGVDCRNIACQLLHPVTRIGECEHGDECRDWFCKALHSKNRPKPCSFGKRCYNNICQLLHPPDRSICPRGDDCTEFECQFDHSAGRIKRCDQGNDCVNYFCEFLHPTSWDPCENGSECKDPCCSHTTHPSDRIIRLHQMKPGILKQNQSKLALKSMKQREAERNRASLPILDSKELFCQRLQKERILVVTAETGSGKSTQLPQYAAEYFGGLAICTQPRVIAAVSLARRVASEYDGTSVGNSVGYRVGHSDAGKERNQVPGTDIMFMTDSALIQEIQHDRQLSKVKVLVIDEAHERSLNTDIVVGLAKLLLNERKTDFYVVIASATIDPIKFLEFFSCQKNQVLNVPGRIHPISIEYMPKPDDSSEAEHAVATLLKLYDKYEGHTLVFLPGQREIEQAIELFNQDIPDNFVAFPLYGSLSPEEQDKVLQFDEINTDKLRMVIFCTNIAETSLTIKNTRLVIDSGLAKEARFDAKLRVTVIETIRISQSSANQRKGRAGRTASGHCVRLYKEDAITRSNIEPEILRSSVDLVVLQLVRLQLKPQTFPFMDLPSPGQSILESSLQFLKEISCIDQHNTITKRGELFAELCLDPRLSAFMVDAYVEHSPILAVTTATVAILTAPGSVFFMGGAVKEEKQKARGQVAKGAQDFDSDLIYLISIYEKWKSVGTIDPETNLCVKCQKLIKRDGSCRSCRAEYSVNNMLNNKVLRTIDGACAAFKNIITSNRWRLNPRELSNADESNIIGEHLLKNFPEHRGHLLVPHLPNEGVAMIENDFRARITNTSVFVQRQLASVHFIAMSITQLPKGDYVIERLHPINAPTKRGIKDIQKISSLRNVGWEWNYEIRKEANIFSAEPWCKWLIYEYDRRQCNLNFWGEPNMKDSILNALISIVNNAHDSLLTRNRSIDCGSIRGTFESGLRCLRIENKHESTDGKNQLNLYRVPCKTVDEFHEWMQNTLGISRQNIRANNFRSYKATTVDESNYESPAFFITLDSDEARERALSRLSPFYVYPHTPDTFNNVLMNEKETWGRQLLLKCKSHRVFTEEQVKIQFDKYIVNCKQMGKKLLPGLQITNLPASIGNDDVQCALGNDFVPASIKIFHSDQNSPDMGSSSVRIYFPDENQFQKAADRLESSSILTKHVIKIISKKTGQIKEFPVQPLVEEIKIEPQTFLITTINRQTALNIYSKPPEDWSVNSSAFVTVTNHDIYPSFDGLLDDICSRYHVKVQKVPLPGNNNKHSAVRCIFTDESPPKTALAASTLRQATSPIIIKLNDERQKCLFNELFNEELIQTWTKELELLCEKKDKYGAVIEIWGPQIKQGQLMRRIADYADKFDYRYRSLDLSAPIIGYFGRQKAADIKLQDMNDLWTPKGCSVTLARRTNAIVLYAQPKVSPEMISDCEKEVRALLGKLLTMNINEEESDEFGRHCVFCKCAMIATRVFRICGHAYCRCALSVLNKLPIKCPACSCPIHIQDIQEMFGNSRVDFKKLCKMSMQKYLSLSTNPMDQNQLFCPNDECDGLISRDRGYQICLTCGQSVCGLCRLINDELHEGCTCQERKQAKKTLDEFIPSLFKAAKTFTQDNWSIGLPPITGFELNPYLMQKTCESLNIFYQGVNLLGDEPPPDLARGIFAFHGTSMNAIEPICKLGFDPNRRRGQVYGPGEYFGITPAISDGYRKGNETSTSDRMIIIAFILQCDRVKTQPGFCYIVNNPVDWSAAFNLPVAVVTYGNDSNNHASPFTLASSLSNQSKLLPNTETRQSPFRWFWMQDSRSFEAYTDTVNDILEQLYEKWKTGQQSSKIVTPPLIRYVDDIPQTYEIDFENNIQRNTKTNFLRRIERRRLSLSMTKNGHNWFFLNEHSIWTPYESMIQQTIEDAYAVYLSDQGQCTLLIRFSGRPENYELNFRNGTQMNKTTGEIRRIKRE